MEATNLDCRVAGPPLTAAPVATGSAEWWKDRALEMYEAINDYDFPERPMRLAKEFVRLTLRRDLRTLVYSAMTESFA